jgi:hypothetical protein
MNRLFALAALTVLASSLLHAQKSAAPIDLTGYWESIVTEDWRWRMVTPPRGSYESVALILKKEGKTIADSWDPASDEAAGTQCKAYGAAALMRMPGRIHITWESDAALKVETEAGTQTRLFHFGASEPAAGEPTWQGHTSATWQRRTTLKTVTTRLRAGYLRKNGVPYSANAVVTEYYNVLSESNGDTWLIVTTTVDDPQFLTKPFVTSSQFKKLAGGSAWKPVPCTAR